MNNRISLLSLTLAGATTLPIWAQSKPNVLIIMTDQQTYNMMSNTGNQWLKTPNMDYIASKGYSFNKVYCANPVSMPSRFTMLTGHRASEIGVRENTNFYSREKVAPIIEEAGMGNIFRKGGYETLYSGKLHLYGTKDLKEYGFELNGIDPYDGPAIYAEKALPELAASKRDKPFFMVLSFLNPHDICAKVGVDGKGEGEVKMSATVEPGKILARQKAMDPEEYKRQIPPRAKNTAPIEGEIKSMVSMNDKSRSWNEDQWNLYGWMYYRLTESVDAQIGRVLEALRKSGLEENTIILFTSDHGELNGAHNLNTKNCMFEEAQRVPFIIAGKGIKSNVVDKSTLVCNGYDMIPTLCDLTGVDCPKGLSGISLKPFLTGEGKTPNRKYIITENYNGYQITDGRYKLSVYELLGQPETLTDIMINPGETKNFINDPAYTKIKKELKDYLMADLKARGLTPLAENRSIEEIRKSWKEMKGEKGNTKGKGNNKAKKNNTAEE